MFYNKIIWRIEMTFNENLIREAAYYNWQNAGCPFGQDEKFWNMAIEQIYGSKAAKSCCSTSSSSKKTASSRKKQKATLIKVVFLCLLIPVIIPTTNLSCPPSTLFSLFFPSAALASFFFTEF